MNRQPGARRARRARRARADVGRRRADRPRAVGRRRAESARPHHRTTRILLGLAVATGVIALTGALTFWNSSQPAPANTTKSSLADTPPSPATSPSRLSPIAPPVTLTPQVPQAGTGEFMLATSAGASTGPAPLRYSVAVEEGLDVDPAKFAKIVDQTLADDRGWRSVGDHEFERVASGEEIRILLATPDTVDQLCAPLDTKGEVSCRNEDRVVINAKRWFFGAEPFQRPLREYRQYVINHETGHALGYPHQSCPQPGTPAPVMLQQTLRMEGCSPNPWPADGPPH
ncbi:DUF3152 domain-containing protein [Nocardioides jensenii]|uniref:DUF3152 domain-containing protein n=1 Tax=Nocardioides jensenii TaxID=1843 RepID=UPI002ADDB1EE|nr:DUF3152 domain-containing protein [Nocardioides jensenii]